MKRLRFLLPLLAVSSLCAQDNGIDQSLELATLPTGEKVILWHGKPGRSYFVQVADETEPLAKWTWAPLIEGGNDEQISHEVGGTADRGFFRLKYTDQVPGAGESLDTADFDGDGLNNLAEIAPPAPLSATDPLNPDSDGDGLTDGWERSHGLDPNDATGNNGATGDPDGDGLPNTEEQSTGADPHNTDTDGDGLSDKQEAELGTNPNSQDSDGDGVLDPMDGWAWDPEIRVPRVDETRYAVVPLDEMFYGTALSDTGEVIGSSAPSYNGITQILWSRGVSTPLPSTGDNLGSITWNSCNNGVVVGTGMNLGYHIARWDDGIVTSLPKYSGSGSGSLGISENFGPFMSNNGVIYGSSYNAYSEQIGNTLTSQSNTGIISYVNGALSSVGPYVSRTWISTYDPYSESYSQTPGPSAKVLLRVGGANDTGIVIGVMETFDSGSSQVLGMHALMPPNPCGGFLEGETLYQLSELSGSTGAGTANQAIAVTNSLLDPWIVGTSGDGLAIWAKRGDWKRIYIPAQGARISGNPAGANQRGEIIGANFTSTRWPQITGAQLVQNGKPVSLESRVSGWTFPTQQPTTAKINSSGAILINGIQDGTSTSKTVLLIPVEVVPDYNRDGMINDEDSGKATDDNPFVFWINDDDDENEESHFGDIPGQGVDNADDVVNGERDLVDFFPVQLRIEKLLEVLPQDKYSYRISHPTGALNFIEMPGVQPDSQRINGAGSYLANESKAAEAIARPLNQTAGNGTELTAEYLNAVENGMGVLLFESKSATNQSFELVVSKKSDNSEMARIPSEGWMNLVPVEEMFWYANIRGAVEPGFTLPAVEIAQNERFRESRKDRWFVFCHGYNVSAEAARGWNAEVFKRLHQMGSNSKFLGVTWEGNQGQISEQIPFLGGKTPDYWQNVDNAFRSSSALSALVNGLGSDAKVIAGHSLGNMLVSSAICDQGLGSEQYFMLNAAVAREAYSATHVQTDRNSVRSERWNDYATRLWPTDYWNLGFAANDGRRKLTWQGRFSTLAANTSPHNYHSTGEEVLKSGDGTTPGLLTDIIVKGEGAWVKQEMGKGEATKAFATGATNGNWNSTGGWAFNWQTYPTYQANPLDPPGSHDDPNTLTNVQLRADPFFKPFRTFGGESIHGANGSALAADYSNRSYLLGHDIPAISNPAGSNPIDFGGHLEQTNSDMPTKLKSGNWGNWKHSDLKNERMDHVWKLFSDMVIRGDLNDQLTPPPTN